MNVTHHVSLWKRLLLSPHAATSSVPTPGGEEQFSPNHLHSSKRGVPSISKQLNSVNIVFSPLYLHWTNDILRCFREVYRVLIPDGYFTGVMFSSKTLQELRDVLETAEMRTENVMSPHVSPLPTPGSIGDALVVAIACVS